MDIPTFWRLIETTKVASDGVIEQQTRLLIQELVKLPPEEIIQFDMLLQTFHTQAYTNDLWAAAYIIMGGCSDDGFDYFRSWLLAQGEAIFHAALQNPESLAEVVGEQVDTRAFARGEQFFRAAKRAYEQKTNDLMPRRAPVYDELAGEDWTDADLPARYPRLWVRYGEASYEA
ncbi:MAG TPA: DUF4240 domain-containing protein [Ktedonobacterales bacterium]